MSFNTPNFMPALPEIFVLYMIVLTLLADLFFKHRIRHVSYYLTQLTLIGAAVLTGLQFPVETIVTFNDMFIQDALSNVLKEGIYLTSFGAFWYGHVYIMDRGIPRGEYNVLGLCAVLGMMVLVSANSLLTIFLGLELLSLPLYAMLALRREDYASTESGLKYFVMGSIASGILLYGFSLLYGMGVENGGAITGSLTISQISLIGENTAHHLLFALSAVFIVLGIAFKLAAAPFHMWAPDVYQGAPTSVTLFLSSAPKLAAFGMMIRLLVQTLPTIYSHDWQQMLLMLAIASIALGNLVAIMQKNIKRMLAYSAIAQVGYMLLGMLTGTAAGYASALFYMLTYALTSVAAFGMIILLSKNGFEAENIDDFKGLNMRNPWLAFLMLIVMFSLAGVPPTVGFFAKLNVLKALIDSGMASIAVIAMLFAVVGVFYYLRVINMMYFKEAEQNAVVICGRDQQLLVTVNALALLVLGFFPSSLMMICQKVFGV